MRGESINHLAKKLRKNMTDAERLLWRHLRNRELGGYKFRRQRPIGPYIVDFVCLEKKLVVEVDGGQHARQMESDSKRSDYLKETGYRVLRFWNNKVLRETESVLAVVLSFLDRSVTPSPQPSPRRERENKHKPSLIDGKGRMSAEAEKQ
ncbi:MAG: endonuclease domain-containing protein [Desulfobacterales bacterium]|nr:endonuclease domain-containing protein [Desulfobacterales bacterium]